MELLILLMLAGWGAARYGANGTLAHARKVEPLRIAERRQRAAQAHERAMARAARRTGPTVADAISMRMADRVANPRGGPARQAIALWWSDSWGYATDRRLLRHEKAAQGLLGRQKAARAVHEWLTRTAAQRRTQRATNTAQTSPGPAWKVQTQADVIADDHGDDIVDAELVDDQPVAPAPPAPKTGPTETRPGRPDPHATEPGGAEGDPSTSPSDIDVQHDTEATLATVHPIRKDTLMTATTSTHTGTHEHTVSSGEVLDPAAALNFVNGVKGVAERLVAEIELSISSLRQRGVAGEALELLAQVQEAFGNGAAVAEQVAGHFQRHLTIQDQVLSDPDLAGTVRGTYVGTRS